MLINVVSWVKKINFLFAKGKDVKISSLGNGFSIQSPFPPFKVALYL